MTPHKGFQTPPELLASFNDKNLRPAFSWLDIWGQERAYWPVDHPFWRMHFPPNGWGCKCSVRQLTAREAERLLGTGKYASEPPPPEMKTFHNARTGAVVQIPAGIDPGWATNPGLSRAQTLVENLQGRLGAQSPIIMASNDAILTKRRNTPLPSTIF